jgi:hypothetical protein
VFLVLPFGLAQLADTEFASANALPEYAMCFINLRLLFVLLLFIINLNKVFIEK